MPKVNIIIDINENIFLRDPQQTDLGKKIIQFSIKLFNELGFEKFNFKRLAEEIHSTEASIYRYFENKYKLLAYLVSWYWDLMHFMLLIDIRNLNDSKAKLIRAIETLVNSLDYATTPAYIDQEMLHNIVVENANKVYHTKKVDTLNEDGFFSNYKKIVKTISDIILEIDPNFQYPKGLATNIIELSLNNEYYLDHLPGLTDKNKPLSNSKTETVKMITYLIKRLF